jgi:hypothetical protein
VAVTRTVESLLTFGAWKSPALEIVPAEADQVTATCEVFFTRAVNCSASEDETMAASGERLIEMDRCAFESACANSEPAQHASAARAHSKGEYFLMTAKPSKILGIGWNLARDNCKIDDLNQAKSAEINILRLKLCRRIQKTLQLGECPNSEVQTSFLPIFRRSSEPIVQFFESAAQGHMSQKCAISL